MIIIGTETDTRHDCICCYFLSKFVTSESVAGIDHPVHHARHKMNAPSLMAPVPKPQHKARDESIGHDLLVTETLIDVF